jgi:hypothetical protein
MKHKTLIPINLHVNKPYNFAEFFPQKDMWERSMMLRDGTLVLTTSFHEDIPSTEITTEIQSKEKLNEEQQREIFLRLNFELGVNERMQSLKIAARKDYEFKRALYTQPGYRLFANSSLIETMCSIILSQNTTLENYYNKKKNLVTTHGIEIPWDTNYVLFPHRSILDNMSDEDWDDLGLIKKGQYIQNLLPNIELIHTYLKYPDSYRGFQKLREFQGLGAYSSRALLVFASRQYNYPFLDSFIRKNIFDIYQLHDNVTYSKYVDWGKKKFGNDIALAMHCLIAANYPMYMKDIEIEILDEFMEGIA